MKKEAYYFPHDSNATSDPKCAALIHDFGMAGYGIYWSLIEILHQQGGKLEKFPKLFDGIAHELMLEKEVLVKQIEAMLHDYNLLRQDENFIWSDRVLRNLEEREEKRLSKVEAGRIGGIKSGLSRNSKHSLKNLKQSEASLQPNEPKEKKEKEKKDSNTDFSVEKKDKYIRDKNGEIVLDHNGHKMKSLKGMVF